MFERFTEKARRTIFFARYEASQYGSPYIESEHFLLGLLREDGHVLRRFLPELGQVSAIRDEVKAHSEPRERISVSVEVPLSAECKHILNFAKEEADGLGHREIGTEHLLLGILREEKCFAARILKAKGAELSLIREALARIKTTNPDSQRISWRSGDVTEIVERFLHAWSTGDAKVFSEWFVEDGLFVDVHGALWNGPPKIRIGAALHFASRATGSTSGRLEELRLMVGRAAVATATFQPTPAGSATAGVAEHATVKAEPESIRMTVTFVEKDGEWLVVAAQATAIQSFSAATEK
jgi:uncharacterized protein (TIGR02246 family)